MGFLFLACLVTLILGWSSRRRQRELARMKAELMLVIAATTQNTVAATTPSTSLAAAANLWRVHYRDGKAVKTLMVTADSESAAIREAIAQRIDITKLDRVEKA